MIFRRYGTSYQSVDTNFDSKALNEIAFRRNHEQSIPEEEMSDAFVVVSSHELVAEAAGSVQNETEQLMLDRLRAELDAVVETLEGGDVLVVENEQGGDWPKTRQTTSNVIVEGENRLHFDYTVAPPLRVTVRRRR